MVSGSVVFQKGATLVLAEGWHGKHQRCTHLPNHTARCPQGMFKVSLIREDGDACQTEPLTANSNAATDQLSADVHALHMAQESAMLQLSRLAASVAQAAAKTTQVGWERSLRIEGLQGYMLRAASDWPESA